MSTPSTDRQREWARIGATQRLKELQQEEAEIFSAFPELRGTHSRSSSTAAPATKRRTISAAGRKAVRAGMRKYWAKKRAEKKQAQKKTARSAR